MLFRLRRTAEQELPSLGGNGVRLKPLALGHFEAWAKLRNESRLELERFEPRWQPDELTYKAFLRRARIADRDRLHGLGYAFLVFSDRTPEILLGGVTLSNVQRGVSQVASLGYWLGSPYKGHGYMTAAGAVALRYAFEELGLSRLEAATMPSNGASRRVLEKLGFETIGLAREYLAINGRWEDHHLFQCRRSQWIGGSLPSESQGFGRRSTA